MKLDTEILYGKKCPYCGRKSEHINSKEVYGKDYGMLYACRPCDAYVGTHRTNPQRALGRLADRNLRYWKKQAHRYFDALWKYGIYKGRKKHEVRTAAYEWLANEMDLPVKYCHIGMFTVMQCKRAIVICKPFYQKIQ